MYFSGTGSVGLGEPPFGNPDVTMTLHSRDLESLLNEELSPVAAYMTGRLEVTFLGLSIPSVYGFGKKQR